MSPMDAMLSGRVRVPTRASYCNPSRSWHLLLPRNNWWRLDLRNARIKQAKELFLKLLNEVKKELDAAQAEAASNVCFGGDGLVAVLRPTAAVDSASGLAELQTTGRWLGNTDEDPGATARAAGMQDAATAAASCHAALRRVADVRPGDWLVTADGGVSRVVLVTVDEVGPAGMEVCALPCSGTGTGSDSGQHLLLVTPDHPVFVDGAWRLPRTLAPVQLLPAEQVRVCYGHKRSSQANAPGMALCLAGPHEVLVALSPSCTCTGPN